MPVQKILQLGNPTLYETCKAIQKSDLKTIPPIVQDLHDTIIAFQHRHKVGRAIAAPQIGIMKRLIYMHIDRPVVFINPLLDQKSPEMMTLWDDCMSFPDILVKVRRHTRCRITYRDLNWTEHQTHLEGDLSELLQHETDHLAGILAVQRAVDNRSIALKSQQALLT